MEDTLADVTQADDNRGLYSIGRHSRTTFTGRQPRTTFTLTTLADYFHTHENLGLHLRRQHSRATFTRTLLVDCIHADDTRGLYSYG
jgi:hypothetical protein